MAAAFPRLTEYAALDALQARIKPDFVKVGLIVGQFHPRCMEPGLWNSGFRPLQASVPLLVIRHMVSSDFPFLSNTPGFRGAYLKRFAPDIPSSVRRAMLDGESLSPMALP